MISTRCTQRSTPSSADTVSRHVQTYELILHLLLLRLKVTLYSMAGLSQAWTKIFEDYSFEKTIVSFNSCCTPKSSKCPSTMNTSSQGIKQVADTLRSFLFVTSLNSYTWACPSVISSFSLSCPGQIPSGHTPRGRQPSLFRLSAAPC